MDNCTTERESRGGPDSLPISLCPFSLPIERIPALGNVLYRMKEKKNYCLKGFQPWAIYCIE